MPEEHDHHDHHDHHADEVFSSWGLETVSPCRREKLEEILEELSSGMTLLPGTMTAPELLHTISALQELVFVKVRYASVPQNRSLQSTVQRTVRRSRSAA